MRGVYITPRPVVYLSQCIYITLCPLYIMYISPFRVRHAAYIPFRSGIRGLGHWSISLFAFPCSIYILGSAVYQALIRYISHLFSVGRFLRGIFGLACTSRLSTLAALGVGRIGHPASLPCQNRRHPCRPLSGKHLSSTPPQHRQHPQDGSTAPSAPTSTKTTVQIGHRPRRSHQITRSSSATHLISR